MAVADQIKVFLAQEHRVRAACEPTWWCPGEPVFRCRAPSVHSWLFDPALRPVQTTGPSSTRVNYVVGMIANYLKARVTLDHWSLKITVVRYVLAYYALPAVIRVQQFEHQLTTYLRDYGDR